MNEFYTEQLVKKRTTGVSILIKSVMIALTVVSFLFMLFIPLGMLLPVILIAADIFVFRGQDLEFEYQVLNGDLDVDKIMGKAKRKRVFSTTLTELEMLAPSGAEEVSRIKVDKTLNYSSQVPGNKTYDMVVQQAGQKIRIVFEPNEKILSGYRTLAPRKVII